MFERIIQIAEQKPLGEVFEQTRNLISQQTPEARKSLVEDESAMSLLANIVQGYDGDRRIQKAKELAESFGTENSQNLEAYDFLSKALGLKTSIQ